MILARNLFSIFIAVQFSLIPDTVDLENGNAKSKNSVTTSANYELTFTGNWSSSTHPDQFPPNPHFSGLIGATHNIGATFWETGSIASSGIERMAELGAKDSLTSIVLRAISDGNADQVLSGGGINPSPGEVIFNFQINSDFPLVTIVSMIAPSPDWFVGVSNLNLLENNQWIENKEVELFVYDAGSDNGTTYTSPDSDTQPKENIKLINTSPFFVDGSVKPVGKFTFKRTAVTAIEEQGSGIPEQIKLYQNYPNPFNPRTIIKFGISFDSYVKLKIYNELGGEVITLVDGYKSSGIYNISFDAGDLASGIYYYVLNSGYRSIAKKMILIK